MSTLRADVRALLEDTVQRLFPGMGWRPLYLIAAATWLLVIYQYHGSGGGMPEWFRERSAALFEIDDMEFHRHMWSHASAVVLLMLAPLLLCAVTERWSPRDLGFRVKGALPEIAVVIGLWLLMIPLVYLVHDLPSFARTYPRLDASATDARLFLIFEGLYLAKWIAWEFFFRGFLLFGIGKDMLNRAVLISTVPFTLMHYGKPELEMASAMIAGLVLCYIALRSRSIWPGVLLHWLVASTMDFMASTWWR